jgi:hypothetical protein
MKITIALDAEDQRLEDKDLLVKALQGTTDAIRKARPSVHAKLSLPPSGGELRALEDISARLDAAYTARMQRMLNDVADVLREPRPRG